MMVFTLRPHRSFSVLAAAVAVVLTLASLSGCAGKATPLTTAENTPEEIDAAAAATAAQQEPVETLYNRAADALDARRYLEAARGFEDVEREYPYSRWATKAQLMTGYAYYKHMRYDDAVMALERFIDLHPGDENAAYAWYLKALCFYEQITDVRRDQRMTEQALTAFEQVISRFPESPYARDAALKKDLTLDHLAGKEMEIGRYYLFRKQYQAAINRFQRVIDDYETTTHVPEALHRLTEAYLALGLVESAERAAAILGYNYPNSSWYRDSFRLLKKSPDAAAAVEGAKEQGLYDRTLGRLF